MNTVITIARSYGSGGRTLGKLLGKELGLPVYDREIIGMASEESGINEALFGKQDEVLNEKAWTSFLKRVFGGTGSAADVTSEEKLFEYQSNVIKKLAEKESCIIIGRCADYVLRNYPHVIKLYFYASKNECIERVRRQNGGTDKDIRDMIETTDKLRAAYYKHHTGRNWNDVANYDACFNTGIMEYDQLVDVVKAYIEAKEKTL
ncbi:MAG: cytidylate kinase-like family protein [Lachnospiraceae bacterium]|nr:cytidylate kinase-like family protein [Lachnospiraceae bacterium]